MAEEGKVETKMNPDTKNISLLTTTRNAIGQRRHIYIGISNHRRKTEEPGADIKNFFFHGASVDQTGQVNTPMILGEK